MNEYYFTHFDKLFDEISSEFFKPAEKSQVKLPSYPPCDCIVSDDRNTLGLRFAMAGYTKKDVEVTATENSISVNANGRELEDGFLPVHNGISKKNITFTLAVDERYDAKKAETKFENGMLYLNLPVRADAKAIKLM